MSHNVYYKLNKIHNMGDNYHQQLGVKNKKGAIFKDEYCSKTILKTDANIIRISCGGSYTIIYDQNRNLYGYGYNNNGQLGLGHNIMSMLPTMIMTKVQITDIACGHCHTLILQNSGIVLVCGSNSSGQLGLPNIRSVLKFTFLATNIKKIAAGAWHSMMLDHNNDLYVFGYNSDGQLGLGHSYNISKPVLLMNDNINIIACGYYHSIIYKNNGELYASGKLRPSISDFCCSGPKLITTNPNIRQICNGWGFSTFVTNDDNCYVFGYNSLGGLGFENGIGKKDPTLIMQNVKSTYCREHSILALKTNGDLYVWGFNNKCQLGFKPYKDCINTPKLLTSKVDLIPNQIIPTIWSPDNQRLFTWSFQKKIITLLSCLYKIKIHVPKFVFFEIINAAI